MRIGMKLISVLGLAVALSGGCASAGDGDGKKGGEQEVALNQAPAAVQAAVKRVAGDNKVDKLVKETDEGKTVYEAEFKANGMAHSAKIAESGEVLEEEMDVQLSDLPAAARDAVNKKYPDGKIDRAELAKSNGKSMYEVHVTSGNAKHEVVVSSTGQVQEAKHHGKDGGKEKDEKDKD